MRNFIRKIQRIIRAFIKIIQKTLIAISLVIVYIVGFGITLVFVVVFNRRLLRREYSTENTFWNKAVGYEVDIDESMRQS